MGLRADGSLGVWIEDDDVSIRSNRDRALLGEHAEHLRGSGRADVDPLIQTEPALHGPVKDDGESVFHAGPAVGDFGEALAAKFFLAFEVERAVIRGNFLQIAKLQSLPQ